MPEDRNFKRPLLCWQCGKGWPMDRWRLYNCSGCKTMVNRWRFHSPLDIFENYRSDNLEVRMTQAEVFLLNQPQAPTRALPLTSGMRRDIVRRVLALHGDSDLVVPHLSAFANLDQAVALEPRVSYLGFNVIIDQGIPANRIHFEARTVRSNYTVDVQSHMAAMPEFVEQIRRRILREAMQRDERVMTDYINDACVDPAVFRENVRMPAWRLPEEPAGVFRGQSPSDGFYRFIEMGYGVVQTPSHGLILSGASDCGSDGTDESNRSEAKPWAPIKGMKALFHPAGRLTSPDGRQFDYVFPELTRDPSLPIGIIPDIDSLLYDGSHFSSELLTRREDCFRLGEKTSKGRIVMPANAYRSEEEYKEGRRAAHRELLTCQQSPARPVRGQPALTAMIDDS